jgi:hypothetical protein
MNLKLPGLQQGFLNPDPDIQKINIPNEINGIISPENFGLSKLQGALVLCILAELEAEYRETNEHYLQYYKELVMLAWKQNRIFGISIQETSNLKQIPFLKKEGNTSKISGPTKYFMYNSSIGRSHYFLPCFVISDSDACFDGLGNILQVIWVAKRIRRCKIGTYLMQIYKHKKILNPLQTSISFWNKLNFTEEIVIQ